MYVQVIRCGPDADLPQIGTGIRGCIEGNAKPSKVIITETCNEHNATANDNAQFVPQMIEWYRQGKL